MIANSRGTCSDALLGSLEMPLLALRSFSSTDFASTSSAKAAFSLQCSVMDASLTAL